MESRSKDPAIFDDAEVYHVVRNLTDVPLNEITVSCTQGLNDDASVQCIPKESSHIVCGNTGEFSFTYPNYQVDVRSNQLLLTVRRTGGGYGDVFIDYVLTHVTTSDSDVIGTLHYTSSQTLSFTQGQYQSFCRHIHSHSHMPLRVVILNFNLNLLSFLHTLSNSSLRISSLSLLFSSLLHSSFLVSCAAITIPSIAITLALLLILDIILPSINSALHSISTEPALTIL